MKVLLFAVVVAVLLIAKAPAALVDRGIAAISSGDLRVGGAVGTIWTGRGVVQVIDTATHAWHPWFPMEWSFDPIGLFRGRLSWRIIAGEGVVSELAVGYDGVHASNVGLSGPARDFLQRIPGPFANFGWAGDLRLNVGHLECSWSGVCGGRLDGNWQRAGSDFLPGQVFGDYTAKAEGTGGEFDIKWASTESSTVRTDGTGRISTGGGLTLLGTVTGPPELMSRLPAVAGPWVKATASRETWKIAYP
jgi:hypothetical protein